MSAARVISVPIKTKHTKALLEKHRNTLPTDVFSALMGGRSLRGFLGGVATGETKLSKQVRLSAL